eukprot:gene5206-10421_t
MGAGASFENAPNEADLSRYFCHSCRRIFAMSTAPIGMHCPYCQSSFLEEFGGRGSSRINARDLRLGLSDEQARRLNNAATLLQILEAQLREELSNLQNAFMEAEARKSQPLTRAMLDNLKSTNLNVDMLCDQPSCPICSEDYVLGEVVTKLPCTHVFHRTCVLPWLEMKRTCPICRFELTDSIPTMQDLLKLSEMDLIDRLSALSIIYAIGTKTCNELANELHAALIKQRQDQDDADTQAAEEEEWRLALEEERAADEALHRQALLARGIDPDDDNLITDDDNNSTNTNNSNIIMPINQSISNPIFNNNNIINRRRRSNNNNTNTSANNISNVYDESKDDNENEEKDDNRNPSYHNRNNDHNNDENRTSTSTSSSSHDHNHDDDDSFGNIISMIDREIAAMDRVIADETSHLSSRYYNNSSNNTNNNLNTSSATFTSSSTLTSSSSSNVGSSPRRSTTGSIHHMQEISDELD